MNKVDIRSEIHQIVSAMKPLDVLEEQHIRFVLYWIGTGSDIIWPRAYRTTTRCHRASGGPVSPQGNDLAN